MNKLWSVLFPALSVVTPSIPEVANTLQNNRSGKLGKQMRRTPGSYLQPHSLLAVTLVAAFCLFGSTSAYATTIDTFTLTNAHSNDVLSFVLPAKPGAVSGTCFTGLSAFCMSVDVNVNGKTDAYEIELISIANGGGMIIGPLSELFQTTVNGRIGNQGVSLFTGSISNPTLKLGTFNLTNDSYTTNQFAENFSLTVASSNITPTPEPSSLMLLGTGILGFAGVLRNRFAV